MNQRIVGAVGLICIALGSLASAADKADPSGDWKWSVTREDNVVVDFSLKLKFADDKLTGTITIPNKDKIEIEDTSFKEGEVKFVVKRKGPMKRTITVNYKGKLDGDTIKGTYESDRQANDAKGAWEAKRDKP